MKINWLYNPFIQIAGAKSLLWGLFILLITAFLGSLNNVHFDGIIDIHAGMPSPMLLFLLEVIVSWLLFSVLLLMAAKILSSSKVRIVDIFGTQAFAKYPYLLFSLISFMPWFQFEMKGNFEFTAPILIFAVISFVITIWTIILMYNAYCVSANLRGPKAIASFIAVVLVAEIIIKVILFNSYQPILNFINSL